MKFNKETYGVGNIACEKCGGWDDVETYNDEGFLWGECQKCGTKYEVIEDTHPELSGCPTEHYVGEEILEQQKGLEKLCKQFFSKVFKYNLDSFEKYFKEVEDKWFKVEEFEEKSTSGHKDFIVWRQLYWATCSELISIREFYKEIEG